MRRFVVAAVIAVGCSFIALLAIALGQPSQAEQTETAFRACVATIPHPARPMAYVSNGLAPRARIVALLRYQSACAKSSGIDADSEPPGLPILRKVLHRESYADVRVGFYRRCMAKIPSELDAFGRASGERDCGSEVGGLRLSQVMRAAGFSLLDRVPRVRWVTRRWEDRKGSEAWWNDTCGR
jgi:hypothetical protein